MTYGEEQIKYAEELRQINSILKKYDELFIDPNQTYTKIVDLYNRHSSLNINCQCMAGYEIQQKINQFRLFLEDDYRNKKNRKRELERLLSQTPTERAKENVKNNIGKAAEYMVSITPQHVSGRMYKIENGDGCGTFCLWFILIDALAIFIYYLISEGFK